MQRPRIVNHCCLCGQYAAYLISTAIEVPCHRSQEVFCRACLRDVLAGNYHHVLASTFYVVVGPYRREVIPRQSEAA